METERHKCYFNAFPPSIHWDNYSRKKSFSSKLYDKCCQNVDEIREEFSTSHLWCNHQNWNLSFCNVLLKSEPHIKDKKLYVKKQKKHTNFFYFYVLKKISSNFSITVPPPPPHPSYLPPFIPNSVWLELDQSDYFYDVHMYFAILSTEKFYDAVIYWNHYDSTIMKWGEFAKRKECEISDALSSFIRDFMKKHELSRRKYFQ